MLPSMLLEMVGATVSGYDWADRASVSPCDEVVCLALFPTGWLRRGSEMLDECGGASRCGFRLTHAEGSA